MENEYLDKLDEALNDTTSKKSDASLYVDKINNALNSSTENNRKGLSGNRTYFGGQGFGESVYDDFTMTEAQFEGYGNSVNEMRAQEQSWLDKVNYGLGRIGNKVLSEVLKMPGMIAGIAAAPFTENSWETAFNNSWIRSVEEVSQNINEEFLPVYVKKSVAEGNLWKNITSVDFWATEGADGIGFIASMYVPGLALSKVGAGGKIVRGLSKAGKKILGSSEDAFKLMQKYNVTSKNIDVLNATMANTIFEAGSEAGHAMENFEEQLKGKLESGEIDQTEYDRLIQNKGKLGRDIFVANVGILVGPNLISNKIMFGKKGTDLAAKDFYKKGTKTLLKEAEKISNKKKALKYLKEYGKGFLREGFWEEGSQSTVENLYSKNALLGKDTNLFGEFTEAYIDMANSTEGQKAIFLGGFLGGPMNVYQEYANDKADTKNKNNLIKAMDNSLSILSTSLTDIYKKDNKGNYILKEGKRVVDPIKANKVGKAISTIEDMNNVLELAEITGNKELADNLRHQMQASLVVPFISQGEVGIEILKDQLEAMDEIKENVEKYNQAYNTKVTKKSYINDIISTAKEMQKDYDMFNKFGIDVLNINNKDASESDLNEFTQDLQNSYILTRARKRYISKYLNDLESEKSRFDSDYIETFKNNKEAMSEENIENVKNANPMYKNLNNKITEAKLLINDLKKFEDAFFDEELTNREFNKVINSKKHQEKKIEEKEDEKVDKVTKDINNAKTQEEVDKKTEELKKDKKVSKESKEYVKEKAEAKKDKIEQEEQNKASEQIDKITTEANNSVDFSIETGEKLVIDNEEYVVSKVNENEYRLISLKNFNNSPFSGKILTLEEVAKYKDNIVAKEVKKEDIDSTEGGELVKDTNTKDLKESINALNNEGEEKYETKFSLPTPEEAQQEELRREHVKVIGIDQYGKPIGFVSPTFIDYLQNGLTKIGDKVSFEIGEVVDEKSRKAIEAYNNLPENIKTLEDIQELNDPEVYNIFFHLPIKVVTPTGQFSFITGKVNDRSSKTAKEIFSQNELPLRTNIILRSLENNKSFEGITSTIEFQQPGLIKKAPKIDGKIPEGNILDLYNIEKPEDVRLLFSSNENGDLFDENKKQVNDLVIRAGSKPGYIYMDVPMANGRRFPMKLNVSKINKSEAELIFKLYQEIFASTENLSVSMTLESLTEATQQLIKENFKDELSLFNIPFSDIKAYEFIELFVYSNPNNDYKFLIKDGSLNYGNKRANKNALLEFKDNIENWLQNNKRRHIDIKALAGQKNIDSKKYKAYLINNKILNTDTILNEPIFQGMTNIYISQDVDLIKTNKSTNKVSNNQSKIDEINKRRNEELSEVKLIEVEKERKVLKQGGLFGLSAKNLQDKINKEVINGDVITARYKSVTKGRSTGNKEFTTFDVVDNKLIERGNPAFSVKYDKRKFTDLSVQKVEFKKDTNVINNINAKYDAEIAALDKLSGTNLENKNNNENILKSEEKVVPLENKEQNRQNKNKAVKKGFGFIKKAKKNLGDNNVDSIDTKC